MYSHLTDDQLQAKLRACNRAIAKLQSYGASWALDCREMRINEENVFCIRKELRKRRRNKDSHLPKS